MRTRRYLPLVALTTLAIAAPASAHGIDVDVIADGLDNPRHVAVAKDGDVYVAEAGRGGDHATAKSCFDSAEGFACTGATGAVTKIGRHRQERVLEGLASFAPATGDSAIGPHGVYVDGRDVYVTNGGPTGPTRGSRRARPARSRRSSPRTRSRGSTGPCSSSSGFGRAQLVADVWAFENRVNPDGIFDNPVDSNPVDLLIDRGRLVVADAGGNDLVRSTWWNRLEALAVFPNTPTPNPFGGPDVPMQTVPTGVVKGPDGAYYMSQLTGFPFPVGAAKVFRVDPRTGRYTTYASGFTNLMDLAFGKDGTLYVLEIDSDSLLGPGTEGAIYAVTRWGKRKLDLPVGTLPHPGGIDVGRRGELYVSIHATEAADGQVLRIDLGRKGWSDRG